MKELKKFSVVLAIAIIVALFFIVVWMYNITTDHTNKINSLWLAAGSTAEILSASEKERNELRASFLDLNHSVQRSEQTKKDNFTSVYEALRSIETSIKKTDSTFSIPPLKISKTKKKKYESYSQTESSASETDDSEVEAELARRKNKKRRQGK